MEFFSLEFFFLLENCEINNEESIHLDFENSKNLNLKTVSFQEAKNFFNTTIEEVKEERKLYARKGGKASLELTPDWSSIDHNDLYGIDQAQLTLADVEVNRKGDYKSKLIFINVNGEIKNAIYTIYEERVNSDGVVLDARIYLNEIDGTFIDGYEIEDRKFVGRYVKSKKSNVQKASFLGFFFQEDTEGDDCDWTQCGDIESDGSTIELDEINLSGSSGGWDPSTAGLYSTISNWNNHGSSGHESGSSTGGGGFSGVVGSIYGNTANNTEDVPEDEDEKQYPCNDIKTQNNTTSYKNKKEELQKLTSKKQETGYIQNNNGTFTKLPVINGGHSLSLEGVSLKNSMGFIHTHLDDFETGKIVNGLPEVNQIYRIFSPADVIAFLSIAKQATDVSKVYATVITSSGDYTLKFTGDKNDITGLKNAKAYEKDYIKYMDRYKSNKERGFLHFLKDHIKVDGIELYKLHKPLFNSTIQVQHKTLNSKGKVDKTEC